MQRKIAAIMAADVAGYSKLVAEDEEDTLRRLASYRAVFDDFVVRSSGRVFNTAGDAVLAEFPSAVEAVRTAIDIQESLRTRNLAYPLSRQMSFRIGITVGDVVERDGDLLGDGVNIAARLEGLAEPGGICVSRTVHEQVANKLSVRFADIGEQEVKNIPAPVHAYKLSLGMINPTQSLPLATPRDKRFPWRGPGAVASVGVAALAVAAVLFFLSVRTPPPTVPGAGVAEKAVAPPQLQTEPLIPETIPFIPDRDRDRVRSEYMSAPGHKALAISRNRIGFISGQKDEETAKAAALNICRIATDAIGLTTHKCQIYAIGNMVVYPIAHPPMPPEPWLVRDPTIERPIVSKDIPMITGTGWAEAYLKAAKSKALALAPAGGHNFFRGLTTPDEAVRRALEACGSNAGVPCIVLAVDDVFVVPVPTTVKAVGLFRARSALAIGPEFREDVARRVGNATSGWKAVAVGANGRPGLMVNAANEQVAIDGALADCSRRDQNCRVIAVGPFLVEPKGR